MKSPVPAFAALLAALALAWHHGVAAQDGPKLPCEAKDSACMFPALHEPPVRKLAVWDAMFAQPLVERVAPASPQMLEYLLWDNTANGYPDRPRAAEPTRNFMNEV